MGRLTSHFDYCELFSCPQRNPELAKVNQCNFFNTTSRDKCHEKAVYDKLREYEDLEEQVLKSTGTDLASMVGEFMHYYNLKKENRLLELPCKVEDAPAVEAKPVVHCKDCEHWGMGIAGETEYIKCCEYGKYMVGENGYCVYGEKVQDEK
jgi:hypothetical protein